jgi:predicted RNase H-like HicB family nuclease
VPGLQGVWATGATLEQCRSNLASAVEDWLLFSIANHFDIPDLDGVSIHIPQQMAA